MKKIYIILPAIIIIGFIAFKYWQSKSPCPSNDPLGLYTKCLVQTTNDPNNPLGI